MLCPLGKLYPFSITNLNLGGLGLAIINFNILFNINDKAKFNIINFEYFLSFTKNIDASANVINVIAEPRNDMNIIIAVILEFIIFIVEKLNADKKEYNRYIIPITKTIIKANENVSLVNDKIINNNKKIEGKKNEE